MRWGQGAAAQRAPASERHGRSPGVRLLAFAAQLKHPEAQQQRNRGGGLDAGPAEDLQHGCKQTSSQARCTATRHSCAPSTPPQSHAVSQQGQAA